MDHTFDTRKAQALAWLQRYSDRIVIVIVIGILSGSITHYITRTSTERRMKQKELGENLEVLKMNSFILGVNYGIQADKIASFSKYILKKPYSIKHTIALAESLYSDDSYSDTVLTRLMNQAP